MEQKDGSFTAVLVGRPNVGKSQIFNRLTRSRQAIVEDEEGVTRDLLEGKVDAFGKPFRLIDTGGVDVHEIIPYHAEIKEQVGVMLLEADLILLVVDGRIGAAPEDERVARFIRSRHPKVPVWLLVNKVDDPAHVPFDPGFYAFDAERIFSISALHGHQFADLLEAINPLIPNEEEEEVVFPKVAIVGRPNVGKSTLINALCGYDRSLVSPLAGTTRDTLDIFKDGVIFIDTAGIRKKQAEKTTVDKFAFMRAEDAIERSDMCLFLIDATEGLTAFEKRIATLIEEKEKGCILFINKWDQVENVQMEAILRYLKINFPFLAVCPVIIGSAKMGRNIDKIVPECIALFERLSQRIQTGPLNRFLESAMQQNHPPAMDGKRLRIYYIAQITARPIRIKIFVNYSHLLPPGYRRYLLNFLRESFDLKGCPISLIVKAKHQKK
ncbi:MAG: ribosome biogenesis GTPase Der [Chlamydiae bacterium RIFCSPHIGHO2_12_FULL_49_11]|nr:MAG: ribosome biogenesis GTPase Der [Chlamydiae bacterium RIFCSPHIGHO2_12_FULL_49_11]